MEIAYWLIGVGIYIAIILLISRCMARGLVFDDDADTPAGSLLDTLTTQLGHQAQHQAELIDASAWRIQDAEELARRISSEGMPAVASGGIDGDEILIWVTVGPAAVDRVEHILTRLDLVETARRITRNTCEMHLQGHHVPLVIKHLPAAAA